MTATAIGPEDTAARVALWRALHVQIDPPPHVLEDIVGLQLVAPPEGWQARSDMHPERTKTFRASIVARARFLDDLVTDASTADPPKAGRVSPIGQYVLLGAGLDTFAQRKPDVAARLRVFEVDQPGPQTWKRQRLVELGYGVPEWLRFVPVDFEAGETWWDELPKAGFDPRKPSLIASTGVSLYLTKEANEATLRRVATLAPGSTFAMTFMLPMHMVDEEEQRGRRFAEEGARANGTPMISFFAPDEMVAMARAAGFREARCVPPAELGARYFAGRTDGLRPPASEVFLLART